ncbi:hypothetical protein [Roseomonas sp. HF4]|uniref:hypothetical protein n=1 Tax=Roseomonas sp. HF4 TaxID=2562313 RepID=UPI001485BE0D|nr:hypothetical protein [Roseomonas sp. HF4]
MPDLPARGAENDATVQNLPLNARRVRDGLVSPDAGGSACSGMSVRIGPPPKGQQ